MTKGAQLIITLVACDPHDKEIPVGLVEMKPTLGLDDKAMDDIKQQFIEVEKDLPEDEQQLLHDYLGRMFIAEALGGVGLVQGTTLGEAVEA